MSNSRTPKNWTVMVYMAGDNNLDAGGVSDLREMKRVGSSKHVDVIAQLDRSGSAHPTKRYHLQSFDVHPRLADDEQQPDLGETNTGDPRQLTEFIRWGIDNFTSDHYLVIIWAHGSGVLDDDIFNSGERGAHSEGRPARQGTARRGVFRPIFNTLRPDFVGSGVTSRFLTEMRLIAPDDQARDFLDNVELQQALENVGQKLDILGMDACLMSMIEVCYQLRETADILVSSQAQEPLEGWPYEMILRRLVDDPYMKPREFAHVIVEEFVALYADFEDSSTTLAACDLNQCDALVKHFGELTEVLMANADETEVFDAIMLARYLVKADDVIESVDLFDYCDLLRMKCKNVKVRAACNDFLHAFEETRMVFETQPLKGSAQHSHGLAIYFPTSEVSKLYGGLDINDPRVTRWKEFVDMYVETPGR